MEQKFCAVPLASRPGNVGPAEFDGKLNRLSRELPDREVSPDHRSTRPGGAYDEDALFDGGLDSLKLPLRQRAGPGKRFGQDILRKKSVRQQYGNKQNVDSFLHDDRPLRRGCHKGRIVFRWQKSFRSSDTVPSRRGHHNRRH
ncbi:hypothetical protein SDC9_184593 [bioreactor metagenome]|uniref:Uncharacterized protein n=1 Tax=bioreactor metagenome TaxID=1076179 RepID=A0A645HDH1_9ZZZZ